MRALHSPFHREILNDKLYSQFLMERPLAINSIMFIIQKMLDVVLRERSHMTSAAERGGGFEMMTVSDKGEGV